MTYSDEFEKFVFQWAINPQTLERSSITGRPSQCQLHGKLMPVTE